MQVSGSGWGVPADETVAGGYLPRGGAEEQARHVTPVTVARQVGEGLTHGASVAQVVVGRQVARDGGITWMASLDQIHSQRGEFTQGGADRSFDGLWPWECWIGGRAVSGWMPRGWQCDPTAPVEFQQQGTGGHVFKPTRVGTPIPALSQFLRETIAMPLRVSSNQIPELVKVLLVESASLDQDFAIHTPRLPKEDGASPAKSYERLEVCLTVPE